MRAAPRQIEAPPESSRFLELTQGCVCCLRNPELISAMEELHARGDVDHVILETTGVADPLALGWTLASGLKKAGNDGLPALGFWGRSTR